MNRKVIIAGSALLILLIAGGLIWYFLASPQAPGKGSFLDNLPIIGGRAPLERESPIPPPPSPIAEERIIRQIVDRDIIGPALALDGKSILYILRDNGHVMSADLAGDNEKNLTNLTVLETFEALWSPKKNRVAMRYADGSAVKTFLAGVATGTASKFLPPETTALDWSPDGSSIAYFIKRSADAALIIADAANQRPQIVWTTPIPDFTLRWASKNLIILISKPSGLAPSLVMRFDTTTRQAAVLPIAAPGVVVLVVPDGSGLLFSQSAEGGRARALALYKFSTGHVSLLEPVTIAEKCGFSADVKKIFCGVPHSPLPSPMPDEWYRGAVSFSDNIVEIDTATGQTKTILSDMPDLDVTNPLASPDGRYLFFQNKNDGTLWRLTLGQ